MIQKHSTSKFATKLKFIIKKSQQKQNARNVQLNAFKRKKLISENFEITCRKWLKLHMCALIKPSVTSENFIFFSSLIFMSGKLWNVTKNG